jgi:iron complex transport system ATP-binding protein
MAATPAITMKNVSVRLTGVEILRGVSGDVPRGSVVGLVGPNGAGKSTLLRAMSGQVSLSGGRVEVDGQPLTQRSRRQIARAVCLLPQDASLTFPFSVREIVAMGRNPHVGRFSSLGKEDDAIIDNAMRQASVDELADRPVTKLSGGEKQRALLARCLATQAPTLLLDEPTTSLDILHQLEVLDLLRRFTDQGRTVITALHDLNVARRICGYVFLLKDGEFAAQGPAAETLSPENLQDVFGVRVTMGADGGLVFGLPERPA